MARMVIAAMLLQAALGLLAPTRHLSRAPALHATNADWRSKCDSDGVVSYYDYGVRLGGAAPAAAAPAADGFEVTMSGLKFKDEVRFPSPLTPSPRRRDDVCEPPAESIRHERPTGDAIAATTQRHRPRPINAGRRHGREPREGQCRESSIHGLARRE